MTKLSDERFQKVIEHRIETCYEMLLGSKAKEYVRNNDRLHNFRETARREGVTMLEALNGMFAKHMTSWHDLIQDVKAGKEISQKFIDDKFSDLVNYELLGEAIVVEHNLNLKEQPETAYCGDFMKNLSSNKP